jgi:sugar lactone lactonase YvrE
MDISTNTTNYTTEQLGDGIYFANGLASSSDGSSIYISETTAARILKYDITSGTIKPFLEHIPILIDNIHVGQNNGELLVPGYTRNNNMETILKDPS